MSASITGYDQNSESGRYTLVVHDHLETFFDYPSMDGINYKEANIVSWGSKDPQLDLRIWYSKDRENLKHAGRGVSLTHSDILKLVRVLANLGYCSITENDIPRGIIAEAASMSRRYSRYRNNNNYSLDESGVYSTSSNEINETSEELSGFKPLTEDDLPFNKK